MFQILLYRFHETMGKMSHPAPCSAPRAANLPSQTLKINADRVKLLSFTFSTSSATSLSNYRCVLQPPRNSSHRSLDQESLRLHLLNDTYRNMATPMGPPVLPGYSLRVQLFSPLAHAVGDRPIRCFRVVTQPEATIREFCQEISRIHEINYGE